MDLEVFLTVELNIGTMLWAIAKTATSTNGLAAAIGSASAVSTAGHPPRPLLSGAWVAGRRKRWSSSDIPRALITYPDFVIVAKVRIPGVPRAA